MRRAIAPVLHSILGSTADVARCERRLTSDVMSGRESRSSSATEESTSSTWSDGESATGFTRSAVSALEKATAARREIFELWAKDNLNDTERGAEVIALITRYKLDVTTPREDDISRGLGDAMDRLLLLLVPLASPAASQVLENLLKLAARNGRQLSVRTIQHIFSRSGSYSEALAIFYAMRRANVAMDMESYFAMLYSLQRLEEEGWAERFGTEVKETGRLTEQALDFVVKGIDNQLLPESKPWLGRVMFADRDEPARRRTSQEFDAMGEDWVKRYRNGGLVPSNR